MSFATAVCTRLTASAKPIKCTDCEKKFEHKQAAFAHWRKAHSLVKLGSGEWSVLRQIRRGRVMKLKEVSYGAW